jgi:PAS domain S-box-containing protein
MIRNTIIHLVWIIFILITSPCFGSVPKIDLSSREKTWINQNHIVRVRIGNAPPFMLTDGKIQGIAIEYLEHIFSLNSIKFQYIKESEVTWPQALRHIEEHDVVDMVPTAKITNDRKKKMIFTDEYIFAPWVIFTRSDADFVSSIEDLKGKTVSVQEGYVIHQKLKQAYPEINLKIVSAKMKDFAQIPIRDLSTGLVDAYIGNLFMTTYMIQSKGYANIKVAAPTPFKNHNQAMAIRNDWPELAGIINKTLAVMTPDEHAEIRNRWLVVRYEYGINKSDVVGWIFGVAGIASVFVVLILFWNNRLTSEIASRKQIEKDLRDRENLLNDVGAIAKIGGWEMDLLTSKAKWTRTTYDIVEIEIGQPVPGPDEHINYYLPEYHALVKEAMGALIKDDKPLNFEARLMTAKGNIKWCSAMGRAIRKDGRCIKLFGTFQDITDWKQSENRSKKRESLFEKIFNVLPVGLWIANENGKLLRGNPEGVKIWGAEPHVDPSEYDVFKARRMPSGEEITPKDWALAHTINKGITVVDEMLEIDAFDGKRKIILNYTAPVLDDEGKLQAAIMVNQDITQRKRAEEAVRQSETRHRTLIDAIPDLIWLKDISGVYLSCNTVFEDFFGAKESEIVGKTDYDFVDKDIADSFREHDRKATEADQPRIYEEWLTFADNQYHGLFETIKTPMHDADGNLFGVLGITRDITERNRAEKEKAILERKLNQSQKLESIGNLAGGIAHDFNNILSSILGFTELALDDVKKGTPQEDKLQQVYTAGKRARDLVKQILAFARQSDEERKPIRADTIAKEVLKLIRSTIPVTIEIKESIESHSLIIGNPSQVHQIFMNLCTNAAHAMEDAGGILKVGMTDVQLHDPSPLSQSKLKPGNYMKITVSDTGSGISPDIINSIFEPYFTTKGVGEGSGMGLALAHGIVESYDGKITVDSQLNKGTVFSIFLPITKKRDDYLPYEDEKLPSGTERILFVDDEAPIAKMGSQILTSLGYSVTTRTSSIEALELFKSRPMDFDLVVTDMTMPNMTGDKLAMELIILRCDIPIILCTGYSKKISEESAAGIGIKAFTYKPTIKAELAKTVRKVLDEAKISTRA